MMRLQKRKTTLIEITSSRKEHSLPLDDLEPLRETNVCAIGKDIEQLPQFKGKLLITTALTGKGLKVIHSLVPFTYTRALLLQS